MAWNDLTDTQMVSYTDAQTSGFPLKSGQSNVTSNQCMTKSEILTKYNVSSSNMSSYTDNQLVPKSAWVAGGFTSIMMVGYASASYGYVNGYIGAMTNTDLSPITGANSVLTGLAYNTSANQLSIGINNGSSTIEPNGWTSVKIGATTYFRVNFGRTSSPGPNWVWVLNTGNNAIGTTVDAARLVVIT